MPLKLTLIIALEVMRKRVARSLTGLQFINAVAGGTQVLQFTEGALEGGAVFPYELITGVEVFKLAGQSLERPLDQSTIRLG